MKLSGLPYLLKEGFKNIWTNRMMSLASVIVLISCLIITGTAALISVNVRTLIANIGDDNEITVSSSDDIGITDVVIRNTANEVICHRVMDLSLGSVENIVLTEQQNAEKYVIELNTPDTNLYGFF